MSKDINIEIVVDTVTLLNDYAPGTYDNPTGIPHNGYAYMIAQTAFVNSGQATGDLSISAVVNDTIRWRGLSLSGNTDNSAIVYDILWYKNDHVTSEPTNCYVSEPYVPMPILDGTAHATIAGTHLKPTVYAPVVVKPGR